MSTLRKSIDDLATMVENETPQIWKALEMEFELLRAMSDGYDAGTVSGSVIFREARMTMANIRKEVIVELRAMGTGENRLKRLLDVGSK